MSHPQATTFYSAAILAGGRSRRFGQDKARFAVAGQSMLQRVAHALQTQANHTPLFNQYLLIGGQNSYPELAWPNYPDIYPNTGALGGVHSALFHAKQQASALTDVQTATTAHWVAVSAVDMPFLDATFWRWLLSFIHHADTPADSQVIIPQDAHGRLQPLAALYHISMLEVLETALHQQCYSVQRALDLAVQHIVTPQHWPQHTPSSWLANINYPSDLKS